MAHFVDNLTAIVLSFRVHEPHSILVGIHVLFDSHACFNCAAFTAKHCLIGALNPEMVCVLSAAQIMGDMLVKNVDAAYMVNIYRLAFLTSEKSALVLLYA